MKAVGIRELKNRLSEHLREVRRGETILVTDRGEVVAELAPPGQAGATSPHLPGLQALAMRGLATLSPPHIGRTYRKFSRVLAVGRATALLDAERGDR